MINYTEKGAGLHEYVESQGESLWEQDGNWYSSNDAVVQVMVDIFDQLTYEKAKKIEEIKTQAAVLATDIYEFIEGNPKRGVSYYKFARDLYLSIAPAAREALSGDMLAFKGIYDSAVASIGEVNALTDIQQVIGYAPTWP